MPNANQATQSLSTTDQTQSTPFNTDNLPLHIATLTCVRAGKVMPFTREQTSAIDKAPIQAPVQVNFMGWLAMSKPTDGITVDRLRQCAMSPATYAKINAEFDLNITVGTLGENLTKTPINGMPDLDESVVCIGDVFRYGEEANTNAVQLRIVQPVVRVSRLMTKLISIVHRNMNYLTLPHGYRKTAFQVGILR